MSEFEKPGIGTIGWIDLTVENAAEISDFYTQVVGWQKGTHDMGDYYDFNIKTPDGDQVITGICHARDSNANLPPQWLIYITVADVEASAARCVALGGSIVDGPRAMGQGQFCVIRDPAGAVAALISY